MVLTSVGVIIGGTNTSVGLVSPEGNIIGLDQFITQSNKGFEYVMSKIVSVTYDLCSKVNLSSSDIVCVGVGCKGQIDTKSGFILSESTFPLWRGKSVTSYLRDSLQVPVYIQNNVDASVFGEVYLRKLETKNVVLITFGTGVGGAVFLNEHILLGSQGVHPEIGHMQIRKNGALCYCGINGCLESIASGTSIGEAGKRIGLKSSAEVFEQAFEGNKLALDILNDVSNAIAIGIWSIIHLYMPDVILLGGSIMDNHYAYFEPIISKIVSKASLKASSGVSILCATNGNVSGVVGSAVCALKSLISV